MANVVTSSVSDPAINAPRRASAPAESDGRASTAPAAGAGERPPEAPAPRPADNDADVARRLRAQYAEISQLAGGLAHEIRNPLSTLTLNLDLLLEDFQNAETTRDRRVLQRVERLRDEVKRLHAILENFLRFARVQELKLAPVDLNALIDELRDFYEPTLATKGIVIRTHFAPGLPLVRLDADLFKQALLNLILNAEHAMTSGGELILTTRYEPPWAVLDVIDTGLGMTEEVRARIFDAFFSTRPGGSGLGLPTTRKIVEAHGGLIQVQSAVGKGSQFTIELRASDEPAEPVSASSQDDSPRSKPV
jgi:two-component system sensor histidine kinase HydH